MKRKSMVCRGRDQQRSRGWRRRISCALAGIVIFTVFVERGQAQGGGYERNFTESKATVEKALKDMPLAGRLPVLDGFALPGDRPLDRYQRGYFQSTVQVTAAASGGSVVHVSTKVTAWYPDPIPSRSGYQLLTSNGRLEGDLLDELAEELGKRAAAGTGVPAESATAASTPAPSTKPTNPPVAATSIPPAPPPALASPPSSSKKPIAQSPPADSSPSAPTPRLPETGGTFSSSVAQGLAARTADVPPAPNPVPTGDPSATLPSSSSRVMSMCPTCRAASTIRWNTAQRSVVGRRSPREGRSSDGDPGPGRGQPARALLPVEGHRLLGPPALGELEHPGSPGHVHLFAGTDRPEPETLGEAEVHHQLTPQGVGLAGAGTQRSWPCRVSGPRP